MKPIIEAQATRLYWDRTWRDWRVWIKVKDYPHGTGIAARIGPLIFATVKKWWRA